TAHRRSIRVCTAGRRSSTEEDTLKMKSSRNSTAFPVHSVGNIRRSRDWSRFARAPLTLVPVKLWPDLKHLLSDRLHAATRPLRRSRRAFPASSTQSHLDELGGMQPDGVINNALYRVHGVLPVHHAIVDRQAVVVVFDETPFE